MDANRVNGPRNTRSRELTRVNIGIGMPPNGKKSGDEKFFFCCVLLCSR